MKLKDWADKQGISYLTAWRWFTAGDSRLANAYQSDSGTIIVPDDSDSSEQSMGTVQSNSEVMSMVLKKTVEFSKSNAPIEEFAAWILSNFSLKPAGVSDGPKYTRQKPAPEMVQNHFKQFLKPKGEKPKPNMFVTTDPRALDELVGKSDDLTTRELVDEIHKIGADAGAVVNASDAPEVEELMKDISSAMQTPINYSGVDVRNYGDIAEGVVTRSVDLTPQPIDYTGSTSYAFSNSSFGAAIPAISNSIVPAMASSSCTLSLAGSSAESSVYLNSSAFQPTQKELQSAARISSAVPEKSRRGRKSLKGKKQ